MLVVKAVRIGLLSFEQASELYSLSLEEFMGWQKLAAPSGGRNVDAALHKALKAEPLWMGSDSDSARTRPGADISESS
jgi:hypothetical protein